MISIITQASDPERSRGRDLAHENKYPARRGMKNEGATRTKAGYSTNGRENADRSG